jgi:hypothetical protein
LKKKRGKEMAAKKIKKAAKRPKTKSLRKAKKLEANKTACDWHVRVD